MSPIKGDAVSQGTVLGLLMRDNTTPALNGMIEDLDVGAIEESDRKKRGTSELVDKLNGKTRNKLVLMLSLYVDNINA